MKKNYKKILGIIFILSLTLVPEIASAAKYVVCSDNRKIPYAIANLVSIFMTIIKIAVPILIVIMGMIAFLRVTYSSNVEEDLKKAKNKFIHSIIAAIVIFFIVSILNFAVGLVAGKDNSFMKCVECFINNDKCEVIESDDDLEPGIYE